MGKKCSTSVMPVLLSLLRTPWLDERHRARTETKPYYVVGWLPFMTFVRAATSKPDKPDCSSLWYPWRVLDILHLNLPSFRWENKGTPSPEKILEPYKVKSLFTVRLNLIMVATTFNRKEYSVGQHSTLLESRSGVIDVRDFQGNRFESTINTAKRRFLQAMMCRDYDPFFSSMRQKVGRSRFTGIAFEGALPWDVELLVSSRIDAFNKKPKKGGKRLEDLQTKDDD